MLSLPRRLLHQTVKIQNLIGIDDYGDPEYGDLIEYPARVDSTQRLVRNPSGDEVTAASTVYLPGTSEVDEQSRLTLPDGMSRRVISISNHYGRTADVPVYIEVTTA